MGRDGKTRRVLGERESSKKKFHETTGEQARNCEEKIGGRWTQTRKRTQVSGLLRGGERKLTAHRSCQKKKKINGELLENESA